MFYITESVDSDGTTWIIERGAPNSGDVVFESKDRQTAYLVYDIINSGAIIPKPPAITGIWEVGYIQEFGILDHCQEVIVLKDRHRVAKAERTGLADTISRSLDNEMMDLYLILRKWAQNRKDLESERMDKFREKAADNGIILKAEDVRGIPEREGDPDAKGSF